MTVVRNPGLPVRRALAHPTLSVVVPVYNATANLQRCLTALIASDYDDFDVLVVDDGSTEPVEPLVASYGFGYLRLDGPGGPARARNYGVVHVTGRYVVFIDADVCVHPDTLARFAAAFAADPTLGAVVGSYDDSPAAPNFLSQYKNLFHHYVHQRAHGDICTFWSGCGAIRRTLFLAFGGFDAQRYRRPAIEDIELGSRLHAAGHRIILDRQIMATHLKRWTLWSLVKADVCARGIPWVRLMWRLGTMANTLNVTPSQRLSVVLVYLLVMVLLATAWWTETWIGAAILGGAITVINRDFYRYVAVRRGVWFALRVVPLHWLYFGYCGFCGAWGTVLHYLTMDSDSPPEAAVQERWHASDTYPTRSSDTITREI
jgi:cellulose synthase/poly-beta-1,6-N-acetylglucosamine synthase-like glycosyltransferase